MQMQDAEGVAYDDYSLYFLLCNFVTFNIDDHVKVLNDDKRSSGVKI